jgi:hypothetical protein
VDETRMQMAETRRRIGAHHIDVALPSVSKRCAPAPPAKTTGSGA